MIPYNLEKTAYEYLQASDIKDIIPFVHGHAYRTLSEWGMPTQQHDQDVYYGLVMDWLEGEALSVFNVDINNACDLLAALAKIHEAGVLHYDTFRRNMMVFPGTRRVAWIDFSCAKINAGDALASELGDAAGVILELVSTNVISY